MTLPKVLITGDSHLGALAAGLPPLVDFHAIWDGLHIEMRPLGSGRFMTERFSRAITGGSELITPAYRQNLQRVTNEAGLLAVGLCANFHTTRLLAACDWNKFAPAHLAWKEYPLSAALLTETFWTDQQYIFAFIDEMRAAGINVFAIESPRTFRHHPKAKATRVDVWSYVDAAYRRYISEQLALRGVDVVPVPADCVDADGFMRPDFRHPTPHDGHHANDAFGQIMMTRVLDYISALPRTLRVAA